MRRRDRSPGPTGKQMEEQCSEEYRRGYAAAKADVLAIRAKANAMRGGILCEIGHDAFTRAAELDLDLRTGNEPADVAARALVWVEWLAQFITERGLSLCDHQHLPQA